MHLSYGPSNLKVVFDLNTWAHRGSCEGLGAADVQFSLLPTAPKVVPQCHARQRAGSTCEKPMPCLIVGRYLTKPPYCLNVLHFSSRTMWEGHINFSKC
jgi:hypothetical protein